MDIKSKENQTVPSILITGTDPFPFPFPPPPPVNEDTPKNMAPRLASSDGLRSDMARYWVLRAWISSAPSWDCTWNRQWLNWYCIYLIWIFVKVKRWRQGRGFDVKVFEEITLTEIRNNEVIPAGTGLWKEERKKQRNISIYKEKLYKYKLRIFQYWH